MTLFWLRSPSRPVLLPMACLENRVTKAIEGHELSFLVSVMMLTRAMAGRGPCAGRAVVWTLAVTAVSDCRRCSFLFWAIGNSPCWGCGADGDDISSTHVLVLLTMLLFGLLHRYYVGKRSPAGWTAWPTSARASPSSRAASPRNGWPQQPCRATSALASTRRNKGTQQMRSPPPPLQPPQPQAHREPVDIPGSKLPSLPPNIPALLFYLFLTPFHTHWFLSSTDNTGEGRPFLLQPLFQGLPLQLLGKMTVNSNVELRIVVTKLYSPPRASMILDLRRTADSLRHESMCVGRVYILWSSFSGTVLSFYLSLYPFKPSSLFWLGFPVPYDKSPAHTQWRNQSQNSTFSSLRPATNSTQIHPFCNYQVSNSYEGQMKGAPVLQPPVFSTQI